MAYGRKTYRRRNYRRKQLSTRTIFSKTSAKSQAKQIYALRKRVNALARVNAPELKVKDTSPVSFTLNSGVWSDSYKAWTLQWPEMGTEDFQRTGSAFRVKNLMIRLNMEYYNNSATGYHASESSGTPVRIIVVRTVGPVPYNFESSLDNLLEHSGYGGTDYSARAISPFKRSLTEQYKVVYNKLVNLTSDKNQRSVYISVAKNKEIDFNTSGQAVYYLLYVAPSGLHFDNDFKEYISGTMLYRVTYTDI